MLVFLLEEANVDFAWCPWDGTGGGKSSSNVMDCCGFECEPCPEFARLRWDEREGALATCGETGNDCRCDISSLVVGANGGSSGLLEHQPIGRRKDGTSGR